jgi:hypothetical protein
VPGEVELKYLALHVVVESPKPAEAWNILPVSRSGPCGRHVDQLLRFGLTVWNKANLNGWTHPWMSSSTKEGALHKNYLFAKSSDWNIIPMWMISSLFAWSIYFYSNNYRTCTKRKSWLLHSDRYQPNILYYALQHEICVCRIFIDWFASGIHYWYHLYGIYVVFTCDDISDQ